jgi:hypothetical protein
LRSDPELDESDQGRLYAWQVPVQPPWDLMLGWKEVRSRMAAMRGVGITLLIELPHRRETTVMWSPDRPHLNAALDRLGP